MLTMRSRGDLDQWSMYEASKPWGPWSTIFYTEQWDMDPGEALRIPSKWIDADGAGFYLAFTGDDGLAIRRAELTVQMNN